MEILNLIGVEACLSNTGYLVAEVYVDGSGHENIARIPLGDSGKTLPVGYAYSRSAEESEITRMPETVWKFHARPEDGLAILNAFAKANHVVYPQVDAALERTRLMVGQTRSNPAGIRHITSLLPDTVARAA